MSLIYAENNIGPNGGPCIIPLVTGVVELRLDVESFTARERL